MAVSMEHGMPFDIASRKQEMLHLLVAAFASLRSFFFFFNFARNYNCVPSYIYIQQRQNVVVAYALMAFGLACFSFSVGTAVHTCCFMFPSLRSTCSRLPIRVNSKMTKMEKAGLRKLDAKARCVRNGARRTRGLWVVWFSLKYQRRGLSV